MIGNVLLVGHDDQRVAIAVKSVKQRHDLVARAGIQVAGWLVCQKDTRSGDERPRNGDALSDTALESALEFGAVVTNAVAIQGTEYDDQMLGRRMDDHFIGGGGSDRLRGADGNDILEGGDGHDRLEGGRGDDILEGGADMDRFLYYAGHGTDTILDATAEDRIEIYDIDTGNVIEALQNATETGGNMVIDFGNGDSLILAGVSDAEMDLLDFRF